MTSPDPYRREVTRAADAQGGAQLVWWDSCSRKTGVGIASWRALSCRARLGGLLVPLAVPGAAVADAPVEHGIDSFTEVEVLDCGDFSVEVVDAWHVRFSVHPAPRDPYGQAFLATEVIRVDRTVTNTTTGKTFSGLFHQNSAEVRATHLSGTVYRFDQRETVSLLLRAPGGRPYVQEHVNLRHDQVFDTLGDSQPGGEEISFETTVVSGELFDFPDVCEVARALTT